MSDELQRATDQRENYQRNIVAINAFFYQNSSVLREKIAELEARIKRLEAENKTDWKSFGF
jgi:hypothetical protein